MMIKASRWCFSWKTPASVFASTGWSPLTVQSGPTPRATVSPRTVQARPLPKVACFRTRVRKGLQESPYCFICSKGFKTQFKLMDHISRVHLKRITSSLSEDPVSTYAAIFGNEYQRISHEAVRFANGVQVFTAGEKLGQWHDPQSNKGGEPIRAITQFLGLSFFDACKMAVAITDIDETENDRKERVVQTACNLWNASQPIANTLAEKYLVKHRGIPSQAVPHMEFRFMPKGMNYHHALSGEDRRIRVPSLILRVENESGQITAIQRIMLDELSGMKASFLPQSKKTTGFCKGSAGIIQEGQKGGLVCLAEGPETSASLAAAFGKDCTVLASLSLRLIPKTMDVILRYQPKSLILAMDSDANELACQDAASVYFQVRRFCRWRNIDIRLALPKATWTDDEQGTSFMAPNASLDWNDVLKNRGIAEVKLQLGLT